MSVCIPWNEDRLTRKEAAKYLGVAPGTLDVWASTGRYNLPFVKVGRIAFYRRSALDTFIEDCDLNGSTQHRR